MRDQALRMTIKLLYNTIPMLPHSPDSILRERLMRAYEGIRKQRVFGVGVERFPWNVTLVLGVAHILNVYRCC